METQVNWYRYYCHIVSDLNHNIFYKESDYMFTQETMAMWIKKL